LPYRIPIYPSSFHHGQANSWAGWAEGRSIHTQARQQLLNYFIPAESLQVWWNHVVEIIREKQLHRFDNFQLFLNAKNLKLVTKARTWSDMRHRFQRLWGHAIDNQYVLESYTDIGKEICPTASKAAYNRPFRDPQTLLWKRCCLRKYQRCHQPPNASRATFYPLSFLQDTGSLVLETQPSVQLQQEGHMFTQFYNSVKEATAAGSQYPFSNIMLEALALNAQLLRTWQHIGRGSGKDINTLARVYIHSKN
jgi:hypothetical protein